MTLIEIAIVVFIVALLAYMGMNTLGAKSEKAHNAQERLITIWVAEKRFFSYNLANTYTANWSDLSMVDPSSNEPGNYTFTLKLADSSGKNFAACAAPVSGGTSYQIDQTGTIASVSQC